MIAGGAAENNADVRTASPPSDTNWICHADDCSCRREANAGGVGGGEEQELADCCRVSKRITAATLPSTFSQAGDQGP